MDKKAVDNKTHANAIADSRPWLRKTWNAIRWVLYVLLGVLASLLIGALLLRNPQGIMALARVMEEHFWLILSLRWSVYALIIGFWPAIARNLTRLATKPGDTAQKARHIRSTVEGWRWPLARILIVYEIMFPLNAVSWLEGLL